MRMRAKRAVDALGIVKGEGTRIGRISRINCHYFNTGTMSLALATVQTKILDPWPVE